jgi:DNA-binding NarL/FixJ family response regulator
MSWGPAISAQEIVMGSERLNGAGGDRDGLLPVPSPRRPLRVILADDHPVYRRGLAKLLTMSGIEVIGEAANGLAALDLVESTAPDVAVIDLNMPGLPGVEVTRRLTERTPATRVLVVSVSAQQDDVAEAIVAGACGYVLKDAPVEEVVGGIEAAAAGESMLSPRIAGALLERIREGEQLGLDLSSAPPSQRELDVLDLVAQGRALHEIGDALVIAPSTVRKHLSSLLMKLQVANRIQAAMRTTRHRIE